MKIFVQNGRCPSQVLFAFDEVASQAVVQVRWAVAYSTMRGCERLVQRVTGTIGKKQWEKIDKQFVTSVDFGLTDPAAIEFLGNLPKSRVYIASPEVISKPGLMPTKAYHPKLFLFDAPESTGYVVGSANLTDSALISNTEVVATGNEKPKNCGWNDVWTELLLNTTPITPALLKEYREKWKPKRKTELDPEPVPPAITPQNTPLFWDSVLAGDILPMDFDHFWVEAGSMSSGGSHNQLELPRGANRFFGFAHTNYGDQHITIGYPTLTFRGQSLTNRPLTWHGNNKMERLNLPTVAQGGFDYRNAAVLFRRYAGGFEINVLPWSDRGAIAWRTASDELGEVFRIGGKGSRICGLF